MQGKLAIAILLAAFGPSSAIAGEPSKRSICPKTEQAEQAQQRQPQAKVRQQRAKPQGCQIQRTVPPAVDPTPIFFL